MISHTAVSAPKVRAIESSPRVTGRVKASQNLGIMITPGIRETKEITITGPRTRPIGPNVRGKRHSIEDPQRDNAVYMLDFLQSHILLLPQTCSRFPPSKQVTYKEMTTTTHFLDDFTVTDWTTLDYAASSHQVYADLSFKGSFFQQIINTRHLPLLFTYRSSFNSAPKTPFTPKLDY